ncbi:MAG TPA: CAP domain-containing protein [Thermoleophilaceae bacterium]|nr:CAP domain-containing protein [Thermoleophilaceae bacterium]
MRRSLSARLTLSMLCAGAMLAIASPAQADPRVLSVTVSNGPFAGRVTELRVQALDPEGPVSGAVASFGPGEGGFGSSACSAASAAGVGVGAPFAPGVPATVALPHISRRAGETSGAVRVDGGSCAELTGSVLQPFTVRTVPRGETPAPLVLPPPISANEGVPLPTLPGVELPQLPPLPPPPGNPVPLPPLPNPPQLPPLPDLPVAKASAAGATCPGARRRVGRTARSRQRARRALLCLLNRVRARFGLRPLRHNVRLRRASLQHSRAMVRGRFFSHVQPGGIGLVTRLRRARYLPGRVWAVGENLAWGMGGFDRPRRMVRAWMHSTGHRANILFPAYREVGLGVYPGVPISTRTRGATFTTDFGFRR